MAELVAQVRLDTDKVAAGKCAGASVFTNDGPLVVETVAVDRVAQVLAGDCSSKPQCPVGGELVTEHLAEVTIGVPAYRIADMIRKPNKIRSKRNLPRSTTFPTKLSRNLSA